MGLGFTAEALAAPARGSGALRMGLSRLGEGEWLWPAPDLAARAQVFADHPASVVVLPGAEAAAAEASALVSGASTLAQAATRVWEDLCLLQPDPADQYRLTAAAVGFPTDWRLEEKMGQPLTAIHAPIHGYAEQLAAGVDHVFATLPVGPIFGRSNWFVAPTDAPRYLPQDDPATRFAHVTPGNAGTALFLRCERQTLRRLPQTGAVLFTIGIAISAFDALSVGLVARIAQSITALGEGEHARRAAPHYAFALAGYAARRQILETTA